ncbi:MAG: PDZ domain-containing protein, partial [Planctomycetota bacterium]
TEGGSADLAGVVAGDRLVRWDGQKLTSVQDWMVLLARHAPGDTVRIGVIRDGEELSLEVTLQGRDG